MGRRRGPEKQAVRITVSLGEADLDALRKLAGERDRSLSWFAAHAIRFYLAEVSKDSQLALWFEAPDGP